MERIKVIGKQRFEGKSRKTGNDYNFIAVHFISDLGSRGVGQRIVLRGVISGSKTVVRASGFRRYQYERSRRGGVDRQKA